ncbi:hypothetical protein GL218_05077 [Daldinia childiae]|uniref:uncharacterized protein n=1 Tax=Daldinia childiae TaxID=326645 RepID=UPI00144698BA|nr:uncharacterized protein GL218_05077 [Daldinia childiae]KAF3059821.1 hypothetical protein GL218_05077 [Daldinia childiae]
MSINTAPENIAKEARIQPKGPVKGQIGMGSKGYGYRDCITSRRISHRETPTSAQREKRGRPEQKPEQKRDKSEAHPRSSTKNRDEHRHQASASKKSSHKTERKGDKPAKSNERRPRAPAKETSSTNIPRRSKKTAEPVSKRDRHRRETDNRDRDKSSRSKRSSRIPTPVRRPPTPPPKDPERKWPPPIRHYIDPIPIPKPQPQSQSQLISPISPMEKHLPLRRKSGQVHYTPPSPPPLKPPPAPLPEYQVYLNAQRFANDYYPPASPAIEKSIEPPMFRPPLRPPPQRSKGHHHHMITGTGRTNGFHMPPTLRRVGPLRFSDTSSDESFVCRDARMLTMNARHAY